MIPAYDANDNPVTSWTDLGAASTSTAVYWQYGASGDGYTYPNQYISGNTGGLGAENIYLVSRDPNLVVVPVVEELTPTMLAVVNARSRQFAVTGDQTLALRAGIFHPHLSGCATSSEPHRRTGPLYVNQGAMPVGRVPKSHDGKSAPEMRRQS